MDNNNVIPVATDQISSPTDHFSPESVTNCNTIKRKQRYAPIKKPTARHEAVKTLLDYSTLTQSEIAEQLNYKPEYVRELKKKLDKTSIVSSKTKRLAKKRLEEILERKPSSIEKLDKEGNPVVFNDYPTHSHVLEAVEKVISRSEPAIQKHQTQSVNINLDGTLLDYTNFQ